MRKNQPKELYLDCFYFIACCSVSKAHKQVWDWGALISNPLRPCPPFGWVVVAELLSRVQLVLTPWTAAHQVPLSYSISQGLLKFMLIKLVMVWVYACMRAKSLQSCPTLCDPMNCCPTGSSVYGILCPWDSPDKNTGVGCMPSSKGSSQPKDRSHHLLCLPALAGRFFTTSTT